uniref:DNA-directed DNA polymerase n=1 Tax=Stomoxys calcitrans TaxID=35570 RepID=A0A1I8PUM1_STOCA
MAFSQSFEFGNSTLMKLESQANRALQDDQENCDLNEKALDVILESPKSNNRTSVFSATKSRSRVLHTTQRNNVKTADTTHHRKFRRSKSDSTLPKAVKELSCDNYSEFFKSDFSFPNNEPKEDAHVAAKEESYLRVSQIEAAFSGIDKIPEEEPKATSLRESEIDAAYNLLTGNENSFKVNNDDFNITDNEIGENGDDDEDGSLDKPIFSEDIRDFIETEEPNDKEDLLQNSLPLSLVERKEAHYEEPKEVLHEISSFLYHPKDNPSNLERTQAIHKELETSHMIFKESERPEMNATSENISLSHMSPDQLKFTQDSPDIKNKVSQSVDVYKKQSMEKSNLENKSVSKAALEKKKDMVLSQNIETLKSISAWNLPLSVLKEYERKGVIKMFDWQIQCLSNPKVLFEHCNLVYSAPTSAGKTLVSEILLLKTVLERGKKVLLILPFISVVREKMFYLQDLLTAAGYRVEGFFGGYTPPGGFDSINVAICTIEKANSIVNKLLEQGKLDEIGTVVVDEVHLISDPGRGYILELLLAKVLYMSRKYALQIQVITMSATLANVELLQRWLDAELFITNFRPVALNEMIKVGNKIYDNNLKVIRSITEPSVDIREPFPAIPNDADHIAQLCVETLIEGCSVIVFCPSKDWCENLSIQLAGAIHTLGKQGGEWGIKLRAQLNREAIDEMKKQLKDIPTGLDTVLEKTVTYGCAFHHAGLTTEERDIVEASFKSGALKIIVATSTLSSGVNLPARRVLIRSPLFGGKQMSSLTYRQMIGRAGRTGKDTLGESILICTENNARIGKELVTADLRPITSCLEMDSSTHLKRALLEVISSGVATTKADIDNFVKCTLLSAQKQMSNNQNESNQEDMEDEYIGGALDFLVEYEFVRLQNSEETNEQYYVATRLGMACLASSMPPTDGLILFAELQKSRRCFVLESELHAVYLVTPYSVCYQLQDLDWLFFLDLWEKLTPAMKKVGELVGVKESFLVRAMRGQTKLDYKLMQIHKSLSGVYAKALNEAQLFAPECSALVNLCGSSARGYHSYGLDSDSAILAKVRCSIESCVTIHILKGQIENLERIGTGQLYKFFKELEMPLQISLCNMEVIGFPASSDALHKLFQQMVDSMKKLETKIYELHGSRFNLGSSQAVARVLGLHRKSNGRVSTSKQILEKIDTPISQMIITYRKLSVTLSKNIQPLLKCVQNERIHGQSITFTSTGRISMTEPNLQNVAKDFDIEIGSEKYTISCRSAFYPIDSKRGLISSDFCQLEMRILAHLSQDAALLKVMKSEKDVFVAIAANWNKIPEHSVTEQIRNGTKQICYGIVYGMGLRSLAEGLKCTEQEAKFVSEQFHAAYPGIRTYIDKVVKFAKNNGYIETITGRRRYLEHINSSEASMKSQAERQAVNSTIQGSAADIAKSAILRMEKNITKYRTKLGIEPEAVRLVLHLHDELIFEVPEDKAKKIAKVLSITMENCVKLNVPLKVKLKIGKSWGDLKEVRL